MDQVLLLGRAIQQVTSANQQIVEEVLTTHGLIGPALQSPTLPPASASAAKAHWASQDKILRQNQKLLKELNEL